MTKANMLLGILCALATTTRAQHLVWIEPGPVETSVLYATGEQIELQTETVTRLVCGSDPTGVTLDDLRGWAEMARESFAEGQESWTISAEGPRGGLNIVFSVSGGLPAGAQAAVDAVALYVESQFTDPITVTINFSMAAMSPGVLGATNTQYAGSPSWNNSRDGLISGMDADDGLQGWMPLGSTIPVRYNASTSTVTGEDRVFFTRANYNATIGSSAGSAAAMQLNTNFAWDYDPSNGITSGTYCFQSVLVHEVGHALGFVSGVDFRSNDIECLDVYRFQRTDGTGTDWNPDDLAEFQATARTVDFNNLNDDANSDVVTAEYRMSDGSPNQASHFREQFPNIGIMDPTMSSGTTFYPNFYKTSDLNMFDAIGWDFVNCALPVFVDQPSGQVVDEGEPAAFSVSVFGAGPFSYQWRKDGIDLADGPAVGGGTISGAESDTLMIDAVGADDEGGYDCVVSNGCGPQTSALATLTVNVCLPVVIDDQPESQVVDEGDRAAFSVLVSGTGPFLYQWRKDGADLADGPAAGGGTISGAETQAIVLNPVGELDEGDYDCVVTGGCGSQTSAPATLIVNPGVPGAAVTGALSRKNCDLSITSFNGAGPISGEPRQGGVTELRIAFDISPAGPGANPVTIEEATCAAPSYAAYTGASSVGASVSGTELVLTFTPGLENARRYRVNIRADVTSLAGQFVEVRGLSGDATGDGLVNAGDRSAIVGIWTGSGFSCVTDLTNDGLTNAGDRSAVVGAWTSLENCAP